MTPTDILKTGLCEIFLILLLYVCILYYYSNTLWFINIELHKYTYLVILQLLKKNQYKPNQKLNAMVKEILREKKMKNKKIQKP